jgi:hypothetical protein
MFFQDQRKCPLLGILLFKACKVSLIHHLLVHHKSKRIAKIPADIVTVKEIYITAVTKGTCQQCIYQFV